MKKPKGFMTKQKLTISTGEEEENKADDDFDSLNERAGVQEPEEEQTKGSEQYLSKGDAKENS